MKDFDIDNYLAELIVAIDDLGGRVNLVGLWQGSWLSAMAAARFPEKVNALVLAGSPIDTDAGDGPIKANGPSLSHVVLRGARRARGRANEGQVHAPGMEEHASGAALFRGAHRRSGLHRQA
jgi:pimeloyl-ACP methyl ester carboxylesterase